MKNKQTIANVPKQTKQILKTQIQTQKGLEYWDKERIVQVIQMEPKYWDNNPNRVPSNSNQ